MREYKHLLAGTGLLAIEPKPSLGAINIAATPLAKKRIKGATRLNTLAALKANRLKPSADTVQLPYTLKLNQGTAKNAKKNAKAVTIGLLFIAAISALTVLAAQ